MLMRAALLLLLFVLPVPAHAAQYVVQPGDTLSEIAARYHVSIQSLARLNGIQNVNLVPAGQALSIPQPVHRVSYRVQWGDTLIGISGRYSMTISAIRALNPALGAYPLAGQLLHLCSPCGGTSSSSAVSTSSVPSVTNSTASYVVQPGDTLIGIASSYGTTTSAIINANRLVNPDLVVIGTQLSIPTSASSTATAYDPWQVRQLITSYSNTYGIDPAIGLAISWQESGFNQNMVSRTGAIGAMQVEPYTGRHIAWLMGRQINLHRVDENTLAGVYWLATLIRYYGGDERWAAAAYYQGSRSLVRHGWFTDTKQYVADVMSLKSSFGG
jgi:LysM repeat protein